MNNFKFYVLTTRDINLLKRHADYKYSDIPIEDLVVVINTKDSEYEKEASEWCASEGIEYHITESNGTAARGKNSVLEIFLKSGQDYFVMIDGDDYLTPHGVWVYNAVSQKESPPDVICLKDQIALVWDEDLFSSWLYDNSLERKEVKFSDIPEEIIRIKPHKIFDIRKEVAHKHKDEHKEYYEKQKKYCEDGEAHCRVVWYSKKAAAHKFNEELLVGEDTQQYYILKNEQYHGNINMVVNVEKPPTYLYDTSSPGVVCEVGEFGEENHKWLVPFNTEIDRLERDGILHENYQLPELEIDYPVDYVPEVYLVSENHQWDVLREGDVVTKIEHPANCSAESLNMKYEAKK